MKILLILDGIGDKPCHSLRGKTPLEAANTPNLDFLTKKGNTGYVYTVGEKIAPESDIAVTALLGYDPKKYYTGRGPLEAYGAGIRFKEGNLVLRTNFATVTKDMHLVDRRAGRTVTPKEAAALGNAVNKKVKLDVPFGYIPTVQHRGILVLKEQLSDKISNIDPAYYKQGTFGVARKKRINKVLTCKALDTRPLTKRSTNLVNEFVRQSYEVLKNHPINKKRIKQKLLPANIILTRDAGLRLPRFPQKRGWCAVVGMPLEIGLARLAGMNVIKPHYSLIPTKDVYSHLYTTLKATIQTSKQALKEGKYPNYYLHIKETDIPGHDNKPKDKKKIIEILDKELFSYFRKLDCELILTGDHSTPCVYKTHSQNPVPLLWIGTPKRDNVQRFTEAACKKGFLGKLYGKEVLSLGKF